MGKNDVSFLKKHTSFSLKAPVLFKKAHVLFYE